MESSTSSNYSDYPFSKRQVAKEKKPSGESTVGGTGGGSATGTTSECDNPLTGVRLDEVARCEYYRRFSTIPSVGIEVQVQQTLIDGRLAVEMVSGGLIVGYLPINYNYIRACIADGYSYIGQIVESDIAPIPDVVVDLQSSR